MFFCYNLYMSDILGEYYTYSERGKNMDKNRTEDIIRNYEKTEKRFIKTEKNIDYLNKMNDIKNVQVDLNRLSLHVERLEEEQKNVSDFQVKEEYKRQIKDAESEMESKKIELENLEKEKDAMLVEKKKNEKVLREKIYREVNELQDKTRKGLMAEKKSVDTEIARKKMELEVKKFELSQFTYKYDEKGVPTNGGDFRKLQEDEQTLFKEIKQLENISEKCQSYREKLINPFKMPPELPDDKVYVGFQKEKEKMPKDEKEKMSKDGKTKNHNEMPKDKKEIIDKVKAEMEENNRDYKNIHLDPQPIISEEPLKKDKKVEDTKNVFEKVNIIQSAEEAMKEDSRKYGEIHLEAGNSSKNSITNIKILEGKNKIYCEYESGNKKEYDIDEVFENKKELFKKLDIRKKCKEITGKTGLLLMSKLNPEVVKALEDDSVALKSYIKSIYEKKELPFELTHDLSGLGFLKKISMLRKTRAEEKSGARVLGRLFDKNKALEAGKKERNSDKKDNVMDNYKRDEEMKKKIEKAKEETLKSDKYARVISKEADLKKTGKVNMDTKYKIDNKGNIIENKAKESYKKAMDEQQEKTAEDVKKIMDEKEPSK